MTREEELALVRRVQGGELDAFEELVRAHEKTVYNLALRMTGNPQDAEDMAQEAFLKAYRSLPEFRGESKFSVWLYRIVSNVCLDHLRKQSRRPSSSLTMEDDDGEEQQFDVPDESASLRELRGLSYEEIGEALGLEAGTVKSRIFRARKRLCAFLLADGNIPDQYTSNASKGG